MAFIKDLMRSIMLFSCSFCARCDLCNYTNLHPFLSRVLSFFIRTLTSTWRISKISLDRNVSVFGDGTLSSSETHSVPDITRWVHMKCVVLAGIRECHSSFASLPSKEKKLIRLYELVRIQLKINYKTTKLHIKSRLKPKSQCDWLKMILMRSTQTYWLISFVVVIKEGGKWRTLSIGCLLHSSQQLNGKMYASAAFGLDTSNDER